MAGVSAPKGKIPLVEDAPYIYRIPREVRKGMRVDGIVFASPALIGTIEEDPCLEQVCHVACLPGIVQASIAMPDIHWGYGFPIGGLSAMDPEEGGVVSPGGVGYDINCGVRLLRTPLTYDEVRPRLGSLVEALFREVPAGVGKGGNFPFRGKDLNRLLENGVDFLLEKGLARKEDALHCEAGGHLEGADPRAVSETARERGWDQCGTLGSGNHFLEVQVVDRMEDPETARILGLESGTVCVMIHSGSRGLGHQVCEDTLKVLRKRVEAWGYDLPDRQLACAPIRSPEGERYLMAMRSAANFAWCNRQLITEEVRTAFSRIFGKGIAEKIEVVYDLAHNIAKFEEHEVEGKRRLLLVHRKGATRAFPDQPVLVPGDMGRYSFVLLGTEAAMRETFGSTCHGAGRVLSRTAAVKAARGRRIADELAARGVIARATGRDALAEEMPEAYKDVKDVVEVVHRFGISRKVARLRPIGVVKG